MVKVSEGLRVSNAIFTSPFNAVRRHASVAWKAAERQGSKTDPESWQILCDMLIAVLFLLLLLGDPMHWPLRSSFHSGQGPGMSFGFPDSRFQFHARPCRPHTFFGLDVTFTSPIAGHASNAGALCFPR